MLYKPAQLDTSLIKLLSLCFSLDKSEQRHSHVMCVPWCVLYGLCLKASQELHVGRQLMKPRSLRKAAAAGREGV